MCVLPECSPGGLTKGQAYFGSRLSEGGEEEEWEEVVDATPMQAVPVDVEYMDIFVRGEHSLLILDPAGILRPPCSGDRQRGGRHVPEYLS